MLPIFIDEAKNIVQLVELSGIHNNPPTPHFSITKTAGVVAHVVILELQEVETEGSEVQAEFSVRKYKKSTKQTGKKQ